MLGNLAAECANSLQCAREVDTKSADFTKLKKLTLTFDIIVKTKLIAIFAIDNSVKLKCQKNMKDRISIHSIAAVTTIMNHKANFRKI